MQICDWRIYGMTQSPVLIQDRLISGAGILKVPSGGDPPRYFVLYCDLTRDRTSRGQNRDFNPFRSFYGNINFFRNGYLIGSSQIQYPQQSWDFIADMSGQAMLATKCAYKGTLQTFFNLGNALLLPSISVTNLVEPFENLNLLPDEFRIKCYADCALTFRLYSTKYDTCDDDQNKQQQPPPPPPPPAPVPPGTPVEISPPYFPTEPGSQTGDNGGTVPSPIDITPEPPPPDDCTLFEVTYRATLFNGATYEQIRQWKYPYSLPIIGGTANSQVTVTHSGTSTQECSSLAYNNIVFSFSPGADPPPAVITNVEVLSEVPV